MNEEIWKTAQFIILVGSIAFMSACAFMAGATWARKTMKAAVQLVVVDREGNLSHLSPDGVVTQLGKASTSDTEDSHK